MNPNSLKKKLTAAGANLRSPDPSMHARRRAALYRSARHAKISPSLKAEDSDALTTKALQ